MEMILYLLYICFVVVGDSDNKYDVFKMMSEASNPPSGTFIVGSFYVHTCIVLHMYVCSLANAW